jgi:methionine biosynthesis protein MetW
MTMVAKIKSVLSDLVSPAPMREFKNFWGERGEVGVLQERWTLAISIIPDGATVLDVGAGSGEFLYHLRAAHPQIKGTGCDNDPVAVGKIKERGFEAFLLDPSADALPGSYDYITCFETLEHIPRAEEALQKLGRSCAKQVIVSVPNVGYWRNRLRLLLGRFPVTNITFHIREHLRFWTERDFREWANRLGFDVVQVTAQYNGGRLQQRYPGLLSAGLVYVLDPRPAG